MRSARLDRALGTLRFRLTFWNTIGLLVLSTLTLVGLRQGLYFTLSRELNRLTIDDGADVALVVERLWPDQTAIFQALERKAQNHSDRDWFGQVLNADGRILAQSPSSPLLGWPGNENGTPQDLDGFRALQRHVKLPDQILTIRVGSSLRFITDDVNTLTRILILASIAILLISPAVGYWLAGRATRPLQTIIDTTQRLNPQSLTERLPIRGTGDELDRVSTTINGFLDRLADHLTRQREFVANAAHELRSPLTALRTSVEVALQRERSAHEYQELLADLAEETEGLSTLINQLLLLAEGDTNRLRPGAAVTSFDELTRRAVDMFQGVAEQRGVSLTITASIPAGVRGDAAHLRQVIQNLLDNAVKFTPPGGRIEVELSDQPPNCVRFRVRDTGIGIAASDLPHIFDRFFQVDRARARDGEPRGSGLGLSICRSVVAAYGGKVDVQSELGRGTNVIVDLPRADTPDSLPSHS